jgi:photosynthetic reaction center cytochrome c subunit
MTSGLWRAAVALVAATLLAGCERPPVDAVQRGYRGTGMELVYNPRTEVRVAAAQPGPARDGAGC